MPLKAPKCIEIKNESGNYQMYCRGKEGAEGAPPVGGILEQSEAKKVDLGPSNQDKDCIAVKMGNSYVTYCRNTPKTNLSGDIRECLKTRKFPPTERYPKGYRRCIEWTKDYRMIAPKEMECFLPGERPPAAIGPSPEVETTRLSDDESDIVGIIQSVKKVSFNDLSKTIQVPNERIAYACLMLELKGLITAITDDTFKMRTQPLSDAQVGLIHQYSHPSGEQGDFQASYQILSISDVLASHDALSNFRWSPGYPKDIQDRDYSNPNLPYQLKVLEKSAKLDPSRVISTAKTSIEGPPVVVGDNNIVLSGNSRVLSIIYASAHHPQKYKEYIDYLISHATTFGFAPKEVKSIPQGLLVRRLAVPPTTYKVFASLANESPAMTLDILGTLQAVAKYIPDTIIMAMDIGDDETLKAYIASSRGQRFAKIIMGALPATKIGAYIDRGMLTEEGKALIEGVLFFKLLPNMKLIDQTPKILRNTLSFSIPEFFRIRIGVRSGSMKKGWDLTKSLMEAVTFFNRNLTEQSLDYWMRQVPMFEEKKDFFDENTMWGQLVVMMDKYGTSPMMFRDILREYSTVAEELLIETPEGAVGTLKQLMKRRKVKKQRLSNIGIRSHNEGIGEIDIFDVMAEGMLKKTTKRRRRR